MPERATTFAERHGCEAFPTLAAFLASNIQAMIIATPSGLHGPAAIQAARAGKHILCEKPLEVTREKADAVIRACEESGVLLASVFQSRFCRSVERIRETIAKGRFDRPVQASASVRWWRAPAYYTNAGWRGTWALNGGGALMNQAIHTVDLLLHFNGEVAEVNGRATRILHQGIEVEDTVAATLVFANGSLGSLEASTACAPGFPKRIELSGTTGSAVLEDDRIVRWQFAEEQAGDEEVRRSCGLGEGLHGGSADPAAISHEGHRRQIAELADAILGRRPLSSPAGGARPASAMRFRRFGS